MELLLFYLLGLVTQKKTGLYDCCCLFWDARLTKKLDYETVVVCFETSDSKEYLAMRLLLLVLGRATQKKNWLCNCCSVLGSATQKKIWLCNSCFFLGGRAIEKKTELWYYCCSYSWAECCLYPAGTTLLLYRCVILRGILHCRYYP